MNGLVNWVLTAMGNMCPDAFARYMGMTPAQASAALARGDTGVLRKVKQFYTTMQQQQPTVCQTAENWLREQFPGQVASEKPNKTNNPIERTQNNELQY